jgi:hypothetical protein
MSNFWIGVVMISGIFAVTAFIFYKASPLPKPRDLNGNEHWM